MPRGSQYRCQFNRTFTSVIALLFSDSKTMAALVNYPCKSFVIMTSGIKKLQSWAKVLGHFCICGAFSNSYMPAPPVTPQTTLDECIQNFLQVSNLHRTGGGETARKFQKVCNAFLGNQEITEGYEYCITVPRTFVPNCSC